jgi:hypothetical protein
VAQRPHLTFALDLLKALLPPRSRGAAGGIPARFAGRRAGSVGGCVGCRVPEEDIVVATNSAMKVAFACGKVIERAEATPHPWPVAGVSLLIPTIALVRRFSRGDDAGRTLSVAANRQRRNDPAVRRLPALRLPC